MSNTLKHFFLLNLSVTIAIAIVGTILFTFFVPDYFHFLYPVLLFLALTVNLLLFYFSYKSQGAGNQIINTMMKSFALRFILYIGIAIIFLLLEHHTKQRMAFVITMFCVYLIYTFIEVTSLVKIVKSKS